MPSLFLHLAFSRTLSFCTFGFDPTVLTSRRYAFLRPPDSEDETLSTGSSQTQSTTNARGESTVILPNGKKGIRCTCGRIFSSGQALGGHRGKCKVPRERQRDREARGRASTAGVPYEPPTPEPRPKRVKTVRRRVRGDNDGSAKGAETGAGGVKYPRMELLRASDYKIGPAEPLAQSLASVVKIHVGVHFPMPAEALTHEKRKAIERFSYDVSLHIIFRESFPFIFPPVQCYLAAHDLIYLATRFFCVFSTCSASTKMLTVSRFMGSPFTCILVAAWHICAAKLRNGAIAANPQAAIPGAVAVHRAAESVQRTRLTKMQDPGKRVFCSPHSHFTAWHLSSVRRLAELLRVW